jgi:DNA polymerase III subunit delta'
MSRRKAAEPASAVADDPFAPRRNPNFVGHEDAEQRLLDAWSSGRMHHAWLIGGPPGIGKATLAYRFARFVLTQESSGDDGGGLSGGGLFGASAPPRSLHVAAGSPIFQRIASGGHADLLTVERARDEKKNRLKRDIAVDDVRRIAPFLHMTSGEGGWRVAIIDGADRMNLSGMNAILKILEEPPPRALLLLVSDNPGGLLPTIRSRTRKLALNPLPEENVAALLGRYRPDVDADDRRVLAHLAEGAIGRAVALADAGGLALYREMLDLLSGLPRLDPAAVQGFAEKISRAGAEELYETATDLLVWWLARLARALAVGVLPHETVPGEGALIARLAAAGGLERWMQVWEKTAREFARAEAANLDKTLVVATALTALESAAF